MIGPNRFITMAEDTDLIVSQGAEILNQGFKELANCRVMGMSLVASLRQFQQRAFVERVLVQIRQADVPLGAVVVELTESV